MELNNSRILAQAQGTTSLATAYSPSVGIHVQITQIIIANTSGNGDKFRICIDEDGTTYSEATAIAWDVVCDTGEVIIYDFPQGLPMYKNEGNLAVYSSVTSAHTFTIVGEEK